MTALFLFFFCLDLDPHYGELGRFTLDFPDGYLTAEVFGPEGETYLAGIQFSGTPKQQVVVARVTAAGTLDQSWGQQGLSIIPLPGEHLDVGTLAITDDGGLYVVGSFVARLDETGQRDFTFGESGLVDLGGGAFIRTEYAAVYAGNRLAVVGRRAYRSGTFLYAFLPNGSIDTDFSNGGVIEPLDTSPNALRIPTAQHRGNDGTTTIVLGSFARPDFDEHFGTTRLSISPSGALSRSTLTALPLLGYLGYAVEVNDITYHPDRGKLLYAGITTLADVGLGSGPDFWTMYFFSDVPYAGCADAFSSRSTAVRVDQAGGLLFFYGGYVQRYRYNPDDQTCRVLLADHLYGIAGRRFFSALPGWVNAVSQPREGAFLMRSGNSLFRFVEPFPCDQDITITGPAEPLTFCLDQNSLPRISVTTDQPTHKIIGTFWLKDGEPVQRQSHRLFLPLPAATGASGTYRCQVLVEDCRDGFWSEPIEVTLTETCASGEDAP
ncbi:hypothetical protein [Acanthopleuribacter pedis]|uniref:Uncharacterized protein n=1 Tax=Acanthopleuribacter pedis TaxID=442870 RepID=A0A8J7Q8I6_9BACT|nr:hypothetical protein [Acanthopleuribacter pedis]MBO1319389.1 hypothetical protein [Acanthopleuribacter pedis]